MPPFEEFVRDLGRSLQFERLIVVGKEEYLDLQVMELPERLRGCGIGSEFMTLVCAEADRRSRTLGTCPEPLVPGWQDADKRRLVRWYEKFGFIKSPDEDRYRVTYVRFPR